MNVMNRSLVSIMMNVVLGLFCKDLCSLTWRLKICLNVQCLLQGILDPIHFALLYVLLVTLKIRPASQVDS